MSQVNEALLAAITKQVMAALNTPKPKKAKAKKGGRRKLTDEERAAHMADNDAEAIAKFEMAGFKDVKPRVNVLTYDKWIGQGRLVRKGEKATRVGPFALFHLSQTDALPAQPLTADTATANQTAV